MNFTLEELTTSLAAEWSEHLEFEEANVIRNSYAIPEQSDRRFASQVPALQGLGAAVDCVGPRESRSRGSVAHG